MRERDPWMAASRARVSDRWATASAGWNRAITDELLAAAQLSPDSVVLDLAAGSGDPALTIAERLPAGKVIAVDSSLAGLLFARTQAAHLGLNSRFACLQGDAHAIPLGRERVDCITCRCGIMFFRHPGLALSEMLRVLKPGGRVALLAWGRFEQPFFDATIGLVLRLVPGAEMSPQARVMFRFASPGSLERELRAAGFCNVQEDLVTLPRIWAGSPEELWEYQQQVSTLCHPLFAAIPAALRPRVDAEVASALARFRSGAGLTLPAQLVLATGKR